MNRTDRPVVRMGSLGAALSFLLAACVPAAPPAPTAVTAPTAPAPAREAPAAAAPQSKPASKVALKSVFTSTSGTLAPITATKEGGFFDEEGLDVSITRMQAGAPAMAVLRSGEVPIALIGAQQIVEANLKGGDFVIIASFSEKLGQSIYVDKSIERPEQLKGKTLGVNNFGSIPHIAGKIGLEKLGLKDQVTFVATGGPPETMAALQAGAVQGVVISPPDSFRLRDLGYREMIDISKIDASSVNSAIITTRKWARENPDLVERYTRAMLKGTARMINDREFGLKTMSQHSGMEDPRLLSETLDYYREQFVRDGVPSMKALQSNIDLAAEEIPEARNARPEQFVDLSFVEKIKASGLIEKLYGRS